MDAALRDTPRPAASRFAIITAAVYVGVVVAIRLLPTPWSSDRAELPGGVLNLENWFAATTWTRAFTSEFFLNIVIFIPIGLIAGRFLRSWWMRILLPLLLAFAIEAVQLPLPYRVSDPRDIAANTIGTIIGLAVVWVVMAYRRDRDADPDRAVARLH